MWKIKYYSILLALGFCSYIHVYGAVTPLSESEMASITAACGQYCHYYSGTMCVDPGPSGGIASLCPFDNIDDRHCAPGHLGLACNWVLTNGPSKNDHCENQEQSGVCTENNGYCAKWEVRVCTEQFVPTWGMTCTCAGVPPLSTPEFTGTRVTC